MMKATGVYILFAVLVLVADTIASNPDPPKSSEKKSKSVTTSVSAKWEATPLVLELAEYLSGESSDLFWSFLDGVNSLKVSLENLETDKQKYDACIGVATTLLAPAQLRMAKLALSMHVTSPAVRMFDQIAVQNGVKDVKCDTFVAIASRKVCDDEVLRDILKTYDQYKPEDHQLETYLLDHTHPSSDNKSLTAILYGELGTVDFKTKHTILAAYADKGIINYVVRWNVKPRGRPKLRLSGYGVELQLKSTEYKSQDDSTPKEEGGEAAETSEEEDENDPQNQIDGFNFGRLKNLFPALRTPLERFRRHLSESSEELSPLKVWQMQALSMQAAAAVADAHDAGGDEALKVLTSIAQNFPMQTKSLIHVNVPRAFRDEVLYNQDVWSTALGLRAAEPLLLVSGAPHDAEEVDIMALLAALREDVGPMNTLHAMGLSKTLINKLLSLEMGEQFPVEEYGLDIRDSAVTWVNDLESDERYRRWPASYMELLRPTYPGMLRNLRRNIYNYVIVIDPISYLSGPPLKLGETLLKHATPVRVGLVLAPVPGRQGPEAVLEAAARAAFNYIAQEKNSNKEAFYFLTQLLDNTESKSAEKLSLEQIKKHLKKYASAGADLDDIIAEDSEFNFGRQLAEEFVDKIGNNKFPEVLINGVPLADDAGNPTASVEQLEEALVTSLARHTARLQRAVFRGALSDADSPVDYLMKQPHIVPRLNRRVLGSESSQYLDLSGAPASVELFTEDKIHKLMHLTGRDALATALPLLRYFTKGTKIEKITQTIWIIGDLNNKDSRTLLKDALTYMRESTGIRVAFIPNVDGSSSVDQSLNKVVLAAVTALPPPRAAQYVAGLLDDEGCHEKQTCDILPELVPHLHKYEWVLKAARVLCSRSLHLRASARAVVHNARMIGPLAETDKFVLDDFALLERFTSQTYGDKLSEVFDKKKSKTNEVTDDDDEEDDFIDLSPDARLKVISVVAGRGAHSRTPLPAGLKTEHSLVDLPPLYPDEAAIEMVAVLDPASAAAQRLAPLLLVLRKVVNCRVKLFLNPQDKNSDMPLKSFYRYVLEPELQFTPSGAQTGGALARFARLPHAPLLSMELRTPPNWLVECVKSVYDLDNIRLADVDTVVHSEFELEYLLLEGHAWDTTLGTPPRGLQLVLGTRETPDLMDTIVMANLGYFQLKANPGAWILRLRPGRSEEIYEIVGHENTDTPAGSADIQVLMHSFRSHVIKLRVSKKADKQHLDLLADGDEKNSGGIWNSIASSFSGAEETDSEDTINVFSVASGHLYERFLRIMMVSVLKHTKSPVKFWFLKNYLSPSLKESLPYMAKEYGFSYELVQYQWPRWLQRQKDRQRTIWGYKILFLDVLFPLHVKKIIFVDADQIVRADLKELVDLDLGGAPYGYTPFCDSRKEMEGFRFWKQGYWRNHLQGRSYHISALYVVDLRRFRRVAAGDRLRGQYQALSQDPNSLSNLDQDLPNNMIHQVAIKSLPQEWLWCETWCDEKSKTYAKTIDLCNNPQTKEAKLSAAMRIVPEWTQYDEEIKALMARVRRGLFHAGDVDQESEIHHEEHDTSPSHDTHTEL